MSIFKSIITRRVLLKGMTALSSLLILPSQRMTAAETAPVSPQLSTYGQGAYNKGIYPGDQKIYLPVVNKEEN